MYCSQENLKFCDLKVFRELSLSFLYCSQSAKKYEILRCVLFLFGEMIMCQFGCYGNKGERPWYMYGFQVCFAASIAIWIAQLGKLGNKVEEELGSNMHCLTLHRQYKKDWFVFSSMAIYACNTYICSLSNCAKFSILSCC